MRSSGNTLVVAAAVAISTGLCVVTKTTRLAVLIALMVPASSILGGVSMITMSPSLPIGRPENEARRVALFCGSRSSTDTLCPAFLSAAAISKEQVVLPTPPLPLINAISNIILVYYFIGICSVNTKTPDGFLVSWTWIAHAVAIIHPIGMPLEKHAGVIF